MCIEIPIFLSAELPRHSNAQEICFWSKAHGDRAIIISYSKWGIDRNGLLHNMKIKLGHFSNAIAVGRKGCQFFAGKALGCLKMLEESRIMKPCSFISILLYPIVRCVRRFPLRKPKWIGIYLDKTRAWRRLTRNCCSPWQRGIY